MATILPEKPKYEREKLAVEKRRIFDPTRVAALWDRGCHGSGDPFLRAKRIAE
jgi:hypothetical protein